MRCSSEGLRSSSPRVWGEISNHSFFSPYAVYQNGTKWSLDENPTSYQFYPAISNNGSLLAHVLWDDQNFATIEVVILANTAVRCILKWPRLETATLLRGAIFRSSFGLFSLLAIYESSLLAHPAIRSILTLKCRVAKTRFDVWPIFVNFHDRFFACAQI